MAQFNYLNELNSLATMDGPITRGPLQRWVKKTANENINPMMSASFKNVSNTNLSSCNQSMQKLSLSANQSCNNSVLSSSKTPTRNENKKGKKTPSKNKSPGEYSTSQSNICAAYPCCILNRKSTYITFVVRNNGSYYNHHYFVVKALKFM